jgi:ribosomal protein S18 acetylase RimI-like enzyme
MEIRLIGPLDINKYRNIRLEALQNNPEAFSSSYEEEKGHPIDFFKQRIQSEDVYTFGAFEDDQLFGVVTLVIESKLKLQHRANIFAMYVSPAKRGSGVGKSLMEEAIKMAQKLEGIEQIYLSVVAHNVAAKKLYSNLGFEVFGKDKRALKIDDTYYDDEHMVLFL